MLPNYGKVEITLLCIFHLSLSSLPVAFCILLFPPSPWLSSINHFSYHSLPRPFLRPLHSDHLLSFSASRPPKYTSSPVSRFLVILPSLSVTSATNHPHLFLHAPPLLSAIIHLSSSALPIFLSTVEDFRLPSYSNRIEFVLLAS